MVNKATICSLIGSAGVIVTSVLSVKCYKKTNPEDDIKTKVKKFIPAILSGGVSIGFILASDKLNKKEIIGLTASAGYFAQKLADYEKEVREIVGDEKADEIEKSFYSKQLDKETKDIEVTNPNTFKFIDKYSGAYIIASYDAVVKGLKECEKYFKETEQLCWCDIFYLIDGSFDLYDSYIGDQLGWSKEMFRQWYDLEPPPDLKFEIKKLDDKKYLIDYNIIPEFGFYEY